MSSEMTKTAPDYRRMALWVLIAAALWLAGNLVYQLAGFDWLTESDSGWYWLIAQNLFRFDPAVTIGYPLLWRGVTELLPGVSPHLLGQALSLLAYVLMVPVVYQIFVTLEISFAAEATLLIALFPFIGVTALVWPRVNALLYLVIFLAILAYLQDRRWLFIACVAFLPLLHRSALSVAGILVLVALWERKIKLWMLLPICTPVAMYWIVGVLRHQDVFWYFGWYLEPVTVLGLPLGDGLLGTLALGARGAITDLAQGGLLFVYWLLAIFLFMTRIWVRQHFLLALIVPVIILGLILPADEIWSMYNYTSYLVIPLAVWLQEKNYRFLSSRPLWALLLVACFLSQLAWAAYSVTFLRAP